MRFDLWIRGLVVAILTGLCQTIAVDFTILDHPSWGKFGKILAICFVVNFPLYLKTHPLEKDQNEETKSLGNKLV